MPTINCTEFERVLKESVEQRVPADSPGLREHADRCLNCRTQWERYAVLERVIPLWKSRGTEFDLTGVVLSRFAADLPADAMHTSQRPLAGDLRAGHRVDRESSIGVPVRPRPSSRKGGAAVLAVVVVVLFLAIRPLFVPMQPGVQRQPAVAVVQPRQLKGVTPRVPESAGLTELFRNAGSAYSDLAREAANAAGDAVVFVPSTVATQPESRPASASQKGSTWAEEWQRPFEPIGHDVSDAIDFLFDKMKTL